MKAGAGGSAMLDLKARPMRRHDYSTLFKLAHMLKDVPAVPGRHHAAAALTPCCAGELSAPRRATPT